MTEFIIVLTTCPNEKIAEKIANSLLKKKLAACINIIPKVKSLYWWEGKFEKSKEVLIIIKSRIKLFDKLEKEVKRIHPYKIPEVVCLKIDKGLGQYLSWIKEATK